MLFKSPLLNTHRDYRNLFLGQAISQLGDALYYVSFMFAAKKMTGDDSMVGFVGAAEMLPFFLLGPYSGVLADRICRRKILLWSDVLSAALLLLLAAITWFAFPFPGVIMIVLAFCIAVIRTFFFPAKNAAIPRLVPADQLQPAFALSIGTQNLMFMMGTAFSAVVMSPLYHNFGLKTFLLLIAIINAATFLASAYFVQKLPPILPEKTTEQKHAWIEFREGLSFIRKRADLITLMTVGMLFGLCIAPFFVAYVAANDQWFGGSPSTLAWAEFAFFAGMVGGSALVARYPVRRPGLSFILACTIVGVGIVCMAFSRQFVLYSAFNLVCGLAVPFADIPIRSYLQATVPDEFRGRVNSVQSMTTTAVMPVGMASAGALVKQMGLVFVFTAMGVGTTIASLIGLLGGKFRNSTMPVPVAADVPGPHETDPLRA
ncbi:MAG: MFS transporter [Fimbriimonadaceae bacterium]